MKTIKEDLDGGLVTSSDPINLEPGELAGGSNGWYTDAQDMLLSAPQASVRYTPTVGTATGSNIYDMSFLSFQNGTERVLIEDATLGFYTMLPTGASGFASASALGINASAGHTLVGFQDKYILLTGQTYNYVLRHDLTSRKLGLEPVTTCASASTATASANIWPANATGYFDYWYTEGYESPAGGVEDIIIESAYESTSTDSNLNTTTNPSVNQGSGSARAVKIKCARVYVPDLKTTAVINLPAVPKNTQATHYYLYRSEVKTLAKDPSFPIGERIARIAVPTLATGGTTQNAAVTVYDGVVAVSTAIYPASYATGTAIGSWTNPANAASTAVGTFNDGTYAQLEPDGTNTGRGYVDYYGFDVAGSTTGANMFSDMNLEFALAQDDSTKRTNFIVKAYISLDSGSTFSGAALIKIGTNSATTGTACIYGTGYTNFGYQNFTDVDMANLRVRIALYEAASGIVPSKLRIGGCRLTVRYNGTDQIQTQPYPGIVVTQGDEQYVASKGGQPPKATVGCMFNGCLVTNDKNKLNNIRWSAPEMPDAFPALYYLSIETGRNDEVTYITTVNNVCVVGMKNAIVRLNYLPSEDDSSFGRDRIWDYVTTGRGIANTKGAQKITTPSGKELLIFVAHDGVYATDGFTVQRWDSDFDFINTISSVGANPWTASSCLLGKEPVSKNLLLMYNGGGFGYIQPMNYSPRHLKEGPRLKLGLPWTESDANGRVMLGVRLANYKPYFYIGRADGKIDIYKEADLIPTTGWSGRVLSLTTRTWNPEGEGQEYRVDDIYLMQNSAKAATINLFTEYTERSDSDFVSKTCGAYLYTKVHPYQLCERMHTVMTYSSATDAAPHYLVYRYDDQFGEEDQS